MERIVVTCKGCNWKLGKVLNLWVQIGRSYISPLIQNNRPLEVISVGSIRIGETRTLVDKCRLQDIACSHCRDVVGLTCLGSSVNHVLFEGQQLLHLKAIMTVPVDSEQNVRLNIQRVLKLRVDPSDGSATEDGPSNPQKGTQKWSPQSYHANDDQPASSADAVDLDEMQANLDAQREDIERLEGTGYQVVSTFDHTVSRINVDIVNLKDLVAEIRGDLECHRSKIAANKDDMTFLKSDLDGVKRSRWDDERLVQLEEAIAAANEDISNSQDDVRTQLEALRDNLRREQNTTQLELEKMRMAWQSLQRELEDAKDCARESVTTAKAYAEDARSLRSELKQVKEEMAQIQSSTQDHGDSLFSSRELDILTSNITKIGQRASRMEPLHMELQLLRERVQRLESSKPPARGANIPIQAAETNNSQLAKSVSPTPDLTQNRKATSRFAKSTMKVDTLLPAPPTKRPAPEDRLSSSEDDLNSSSPPPYSLEPDSKGDRTDRIMKSGAVDKRGLKRISRVTRIRNSLPDD